MTNVPTAEASFCTREHVWNVRFAAGAVAKKHDFIKFLQQSSFLCLGSSVG